GCCLPGPRPACPRRARARDGCHDGHGLHRRPAQAGWPGTAGREESGATMDGIGTWAASFLCLL
ncbi:hypothetical protein ABTQ08_21140, partial [Acinetobacter baumannii]